jgi:hypothetical protein
MVTRHVAGVTAFGVPVSFERSEPPRGEEIAKGEDLGFEHAAARVQRSKLVFKTWIAKRDAEGCADARGDP